MIYNYEDLKMLKEHLSGIYKITCLINNKSYIGQSCDIYKRWKQHFNQEVNDGTIFHNSILKYGKENFIFEILEITQNLNEREEYWINKYNTYIHSPNSQGYNMTKGGDDNPNYVQEKRIRAYQIIDGQKQYPGRIFKSLNYCVRILSQETGLKFNSSSIWSICNGKKYFQHHGYTFCYIDEENNDIPTGYIRGKLGVKGTKIIVKNLNTNDIYGPYDSFRRAEAVLGVPYQTLSKTVNNNRPITKGKWKNWQAFEIEKE